MDRNLERDIVKRVQGGEAEAFEYLIQAYQRSLFVMVNNFLRHSHPVEDVVQEVFLAAYKNIRSYRLERGKFSTWLFKIARNRCLNEIRKKQETAVEDFPILRSADDPSVSLLEKEMMQRLDEALERFPHQDRSIFIMAEIEGLPYADIAEIENMKLGTVKSRLSRIREKLRTLLNDLNG